MYIIPEAVHIDKILVHDEKTCCMKSDIKVTLHLDAMEDHHEHSIFMHLSNVFQAKLIDLFGKHPEVILYITCFFFVFLHMEDSYHLEK